VTLSNDTAQADDPWDRLTRELPPFGEFLNSRASVAVIKDDYLKKRDQHARAQLRSVPLFREFGFEQIVHTEIWENEFRLVDYNHISSEEAREQSQTLKFPIVHVLTQEGISDYGEEDLVWDLLTRAADNSERYVLVTDTTTPRLPRKIAKAGKSIPDAFSDVVVKSYDDLVRSYIKEYYESSLPLAVTRNPYFHTISEYHAERGAPASELEALFNYREAPPQSPVWEPLYYFIRHDLDAVLESLSDRIREALRSWIERGETQTIASSIYDTLYNTDFEESQLDTYRTQTPPR